MRALIAHGWINEKGDDLILAIERLIEKELRMAEKKNEVGTNRNPMLIGQPEVVYPKPVMDGRFIRILEVAPGGRKTKRFRVDSKEGGYEISYVYFYPKWRKYVFEPLPDTVYEEVCMREIAQFIEDQTKRWRTR